MKKMLGIISALALAFAIPAQARDAEPYAAAVLVHDADSVTTTNAITKTFDTSKAKRCEVEVNNVAGTDERDLIFYCMDPENVDTLYTWDTVVVASADYARVLIDPSVVNTTGAGLADTTIFQAPPCPSKTKLSIEGLNTALMYLFVCH